VQLSGAQMLEAGPTAALWVPTGKERPRLSLYAVGRYGDGWLSDSGAIYLWPKGSGWLTIRLSTPRVVGPNTITFGLPGNESTAVHLVPGHPQTVNLPVCGGAHWYATYRAKQHGMLGLRSVSVRASVPVFRPSASACPSPEPVS
jgi:hypothetical protein